MLRRMVSDPSSDSSSSGGGGGAALFAVPRLFVGFAPKRAPDGESSRSPTSPLDPKALLLRSPRSPRTWDAEPGRGLVDVLAGDNKNCLLSPRLRLKSYASLPKNCGGGGHSPPELGKTMSCPTPDAVAAGMSVPSSKFFFGDLKSGPEAAHQGDGGALLNDKRHSFDLGKLTPPGSLPASMAARRFIGSVSASEIEQSEDYTRIIARGPNPKTTHIFGDCILEPLPADDEAAMEEEAAAESYLVVKRAEEDATAGEDFLSSCFTCRKKLEGSDIYIYRGEKAFCSSSCRDQEILIEEEAENTTTTTTTIDSPRSTCSSFQDDIFMAGMVVTT
ncbi:hypothetical protein PR202_gb20711 [Eleusine coracana subsp. coracana]|uniref:FLZ-type domain-containing protein n=1 Tax=Eleusine coracana subsp. coracana TaxID=191504 RepID=A0AAV5FB54_ELECO|nr:hypothetical protein QOZ80_1BG0060800 [Eleusine coracana subsp. coracana]GJN32222.1 hypothetical protein PR202_gb20711 [Eleusine coracana subsp. coracana]